MSAVKKVRIEKIVEETWRSGSGPTLAQIERFVEDCKRIGVPSDQALYVVGPDPLAPLGSYARSVTPKMSAVLNEVIEEAL